MVDGERTRLGQPLTVSGWPEMGDAVPEIRPPEQPPHRRVLTPRRLAAAVALVLLALSVRRHLRFARDVIRHRRRLKLAFTVLVLLRHLGRT